MGQTYEEKRRKIQEEVEKLTPTPEQLEDARRFHSKPNMSDEDATRHWRALEVLQRLNHF